MIKGVFGTTLSLSVDMQQSITKVGACFFRVSWYKLHHQILILKSLLEMLDIILVALYSTTFQLLLLRNNLLVIVSIPKLVVAFDMIQDCINQILQLQPPVEFNGKFDKIVLHVVFDQIYQLFGQQQLLDILKQIRNIVDIELGLNSLSYVVSCKKTLL